MRLKQLLEGIKTVGILGDTDVEIQGVYDDSRLVGAGDVFVALSGGNEDGNKYIEDALMRGAVAVVAEKIQKKYGGVQIAVPDTRKAVSVMAANYYQNPQNKLKIIGITGTNGKTTTCHLLASVLNAAGKKTGIIGTLGCYFDGRQLPSALTTPDPLALFRILSEMLAAGVEYVVMEVSAHAVWYKKTYAISFCACIFTNCTQDHLDFFPTMEKYASVKESLLTDRRHSIAVVNADDPLGKKILQEREDAVGYGLKTPCDHFAIVRKYGKTTVLLLNLEDELCETELRLIGGYNVYNALAAATCAKKLGIGIADIGRGLSALSGVSGRLERAGSVHGGEIFVDFAHTPDGLKNVLSAAKENCAGKLYCVFGCGGNRDAGKRPLMGEIAGELTDFSVLTSDNPRYEEPYSILSAVERGYRKYSRNYVVVQDRRKAIEYAMRRLQEGDVLVVAGKGAENYQEIMGIKYDYNDKTVIEETIRRIASEE